jgi:hypothetical protein
MKKLFLTITIGFIISFGFIIKSLAQDYNYLEILLNNEIILDVDKKKYRLQFKADGRLLEYYKGDSWDHATWKKINDKGKFSFDYSKAGAGAVKSQTLQIDFSKMTWNIYGKAANGKSYDTTWKILSPKQFVSGTQPTKNEIRNNEMIFTINDKREQCEAIGFKTETEKFADCVLRLVELDIKKQQSNKIAQAQNSGNDALVKQLQQQQYDRGTDALLNLGQQLLNPKTSNSNVYMPQTQRCTIQGFGTFAKMVCR